MDAAITGALMSDQRYPLAWPPGRPRAQFREGARFDTSFSRARDGLGDELDRLGAREVVLSTNIELRLDGQPYANRAQPQDVGVAVYFTYKKRPMCFACDRWNRIEDNIQAIRKTIEALRGIARWGSGDMLEAAFTGFAALPGPGQNTVAGWRTVLGFAEGEHPDLESIEARYRKRAALAHSDREGGNNETMVQLNLARDQARQELG